MIADPESKPYWFINGGLRVSLLLLALSAPISIAATQTAWALALLFWLLRFGLVRPSIKINAIGLAVLCFVGLSLVSSIFSYEPGVSIRKMVAVSLVTIAYLVVDTVKDRRLLIGIVALLITGCVASCVYTFATQAIGKNLKVVSLAPDSPLRTAGILENDTILTAGGIEIHTPDDLTLAIGGADMTVPVIVYRHELLLKFDLQARQNLELGITSWTRGRDTRAAGFYGHYTTFAESLQLVGALTLGLLILTPGGRLSPNSILLGLALLAICLALFLTVTRASWAGFAISAGVIIMMSASRKVVLICVLVAVPVAVIGLMYLQQTRNVSFIDTGDGSTSWRLIVWREALNVLSSGPRHAAVGVGMDSLKTHWQDWQMFDNGKQPIGHLHSTPLQLAFERGIPAFIAWLIWMALFLRMLYKNIRNESGDWLQRGILLGAFGGTIGFLASGLVHYNWGDSEVVMIFYLLMGLCLAAINLSASGEVMNDAATPQ